MQKLFLESQRLFLREFTNDDLKNLFSLNSNPEVMKKYWGKGYSTEMTNELIQYGFIQKNLNKIVGITHSDNIASQKVLQKAGLTYIKKAHFYKTNVMYFAIYAEDFQSKIT